MYKTSKDHARLYELAKAGEEVVCFTEGETHYAHVISYKKNKSEIFGRNFVGSDQGAVYFTLQKV